MGVLVALCFLSALVIFVSVVMYCTLKRNSSKVYASKYILKKFESNDNAYSVTEMIEFHKNKSKLGRVQR